MFKQIMVTGILIMMITVLNAKTSETSGTLITSAVPGINEEALINRLAVDNDFKKYYISNVEFANKVIATGTGKLFLKYIQNNISAEESAILFSKMHVSGKEAFDAIAVNLRDEALAFFNKFPELKQLTEKEQKTLLFNAFRKISTDKTIKIRFAKAKIITPEECFWAWMVCNSLCAITCSYDPNYSGCMWECGSACGGAYGFCWFIAE